MENLLEKMITDKKSEELARLDAIKIVNSLFSELLDREKKIFYLVVLVWLEIKEKL